MVGIDLESDGLVCVVKLGLEIIYEGVDWLLVQFDKFDLVFEVISVYVYWDVVFKYVEVGIWVIDLMLVVVGLVVILLVNLCEYLDVLNVNMIICGGQVIILIVYVVFWIVEVFYVEIVVLVVFVLVGLGMCVNIDEFIKIIVCGVQIIGGVVCGKVIIILNFVDLLMIMCDIIFCVIFIDVDCEVIVVFIYDVVKEVQMYVFGYWLFNELQFDELLINLGGQVLVIMFVEVEGVGDYLLFYVGNLDIMIVVVIKVGEEIVKEMLVVGGV